jgi:hypothetical protein
MQESLEGDSNVTVRSEQHPEKQLRARFSTYEGTQINGSDEQSANANPSIHESWEPDSNLTTESARQPLKQPGQSFSREAGMQMNESDGQSQNDPVSMSER